MQHNEIQRLLSFSPSVKILRAKTAPLIISFLFKEFKARNLIAISAYEVTNHLAEYIETLEDREILELAGKDSLKFARHLIDDWCSEDNRYLTRYPDEQGEPILELTTHTEKAFQWIQTLQKREFVGTESRFLDIYRQLKDLIDNTSADPKIKIKELEKQKKAIIKEINEIKKAGTVSTYTDTQIKERFYNVTKTARELISDFKEVEQNFKGISQNIYKQQTTQNVHRGQILGYALDATEELKESDQGKSFYAFWQFLIADNKQDELMDMIHQTYNLLRLRNIEQADNFLRRIKIYLHNAGQKVINSNHLLADKLSRILAEGNFVERRRATEIINDIKYLALQKVGKFSGNRAFIEIEGTTDIDMSFDRPLGEPEEIADFKNQPKIVGSTRFGEANLGLLFDQFELNRKELESNIEVLLTKKSSITFAEIIKTYPIKNGLAEVITYFSIASKAEQHKIETAQKEDIPWLHEETNIERKITLPKLVFCRS
jgi:hypothetical protein